MEKRQDNGHIVPNLLPAEECEQSAHHKNDQPCDKCECCLYCQKFIKKECMEIHKPPCLEEYSLSTALQYYRTQDICDSEEHDNSCHGFGQPYCMKCVDCDKCGKHIRRYLVERHATITCEKLSREEVKKTIAERRHAEETKTP